MARRGANALSESRKSLHIAFFEELHEELLERSERLGVSAAVLARELIANWLEDQRQDDVAEKIRAYAAEISQSCDGLDAQVERAGIDELFEI